MKKFFYLAVPIILLVGFLASVANLICAVYMLTPAEYTQAQRSAELLKGVVPKDVIVFRENTNVALGDICLVVKAEPESRAPDAKDYVFCRASYGELLLIPKSAEDCDSTSCHDLLAIEAVRKNDKAAQDAFLDVMANH